MSYTTDDLPLWYVIHTLPRQEDRAESNLRAWGVETFAPKLKETRINEFSRQLNWVVGPLFPGYIFAHFRAGSLYHKVCYTRGVHSVVSFGNFPTPVEDEVISIVRSQIGQDGYVRMGEQFEPGDEVTIKAGPLKDFVGIFEREIKNADRVMILLKTINYQAHVEVERSLVKKLCAAG